MKLCSIRRARSWLAGSLAWSVLGCGASVGGGAAKPDPGDAASAASPRPSACDHYFAALHSSRCGGPLPPPEEVARVHARFEQVCRNEIALAGSGVTEAALDACASALDLGPCQLPDGAPVACRFQGSLPGGAACTDGIQCASGGCDNHVRISTVGPLNTPTCGTCGPIVGLGQVCAGQGVSAGCAPDQTCLIVPGMESSATPTYTCTAIVEGDVGAACDGDTATCKAGLYCAPACDGGPNCWTGKCSKLGEAGAPCGTGGTAPGSGGCLAPFECVGLPEGPRCSSGSAGSFCLYDDYCGNGLGCAPGPCSPTNARIGCASSGTCEPITWGVPGQTCDGYKSRCLVGSCNFGPYFPFVPGDGGALSGTCPTVVPDGQACTMNDTCDTLSECFEGKCALVDSVVCTGGDADGAAMGEAGEGGEGG